jgi:hypothetical protein
MCMGSSVDFYTKRTQHAGTFHPFLSLLDHALLNIFTLCVDCFLLTDNGIGDSPNGIHSASRLLLAQIEVISSPLDRHTIDSRFSQGFIAARVSGEFGNSIPPEIR